MENEIKMPRSSILCFNIPAEIAINDAICEVENLPADPLLTEAVIKLLEAKKLVGEYFDGLVLTKS